VVTPAVTRALREAVRRALRSRSWSDAESALASLKAIEPLSAETRGLELELCLLAGRPRDAAVLADQLAEHFPASPRVQYLAGWAASLARQWAVAAARFRESDRLHPNPHTRRRLGRALTNLEEWDEAQRTLEPLVDSIPACHLDLAWLWERRGEVQRALRHVETYCARDAEHAFARAQRLRLRAAALDPAALVDEVDGLGALGEEVPDGILPAYVHGLLVTARIDRARQFIAERAATLPGATAIAIAWNCYRHPAYDLAYPLFAAAFAANMRNIKFLRAIETAADRIGKLPELIELFEQHAAEHKPLYGRAKALRLRCR
jgi:tetratricopeptide (TPR) repeat protein